MHAGGQGFEPLILHRNDKRVVFFGNRRRVFIKKYKFFGFERPIDDQLLTYFQDYGAYCEVRTIIRS